MKRVSILIVLLLAFLTVSLNSTLVLTQPHNDALLVGPLSTLPLPTVMVCVLCVFVQSVCVCTVYVCLFVCCHCPLS